MLNLVLSYNFKVLKCYFIFFGTLTVKFNQILKNLAKNPDSQQLTETNRNFPKFPEFVSRNIFESRFVSGK